MSLRDYLAPMLTFLVLTELEGYLPKLDGQTHPVWYPVAYAAKIAIVSAVAWACRSSWRDLKPRPGPAGLGLATALGLVVAALWVGLDGLYPPLPLGKRMGFDPSAIPNAVGRVAFIAVRFYGLVLIVPLVEELFWRSFVMRFVIDPDFAKVPIGRVTPLAAAITSVLFALPHPEWLPALITGLLWAGLLWKTRSVSACFLSHAVANLALGIYVLARGAWQFW
jgi:CAAX prenyl protease-like protein